MIPHNDPEFIFSDQKKCDILSSSVSGDSKLIKVFVILTSGVFFNLSNMKCKKLKMCDT